MFSNITDKEVLDAIRAGNKRILVKVFRHHIRFARRLIYLKGGASGEAREYLRETLATLWMEVRDGNLSEPFLLKKYIEEKIQELWNKRHSETEIRDFLNRKTSRENSPLRKAGVVLTVFFFLSLVVWWNLDVQPEFSQIEQKNHQVTATQGEGENEKKASRKEKKQSPETPKVTEVASDPVSEEDSLIAEPDSIQVHVGAATEDESIVIRKDELVLTRIYEIVNVSPIQETKLSDEVAGKLNPEANLPEGEKKGPKSVMVEFWKSPVNYKGYKKTKSKIIFYGLPEPDWVNLFESGDKVFLEYAGSFFILPEQEEFSSFQKVPTPSFALQQKK